jgi:hypothetical protein
MGATGRSAPHPEDGASAVSIRLLSAALLLATAPTLPALAQSVHDTHADASGAHAGRSPHKVYRPVAAQPCRQTAMHSLPAGKPHSYGTHALRGADCAATRVAAADGPADALAAD